MPQQTPLIQVHEQVLASAVDTQNSPPLKLFRIHAQGPAQRLAHAQTQDFGARDAVGKTQAGDFDFGQFWHVVWACKPTNWLIEARIMIAAS
jgi:hypothetical protein